MNKFLWMCCTLVVLSGVVMAAGQPAAAGTYFGAVSPMISSNGQLTVEQMNAFIEADKQSSGNSDVTGAVVGEPVNPRCHCDIHCPPNAIREGECCPNWWDSFNAGCHSWCNQPVFSAIQCNQTICGTVYARSWQRDTDWYQIVLTEQDSLTWTVTAEFAPLIAILGPGANGCVDYITYANPATDTACGTVSVAACLQPGTYWLYVGPSSWQYLDCATYVATLSCRPCEEGETFPYTHLDMGDLPLCNYPTMVNNPAHGLSDVAWLGESISWEETPNSVDVDPFDDGVVYVNAANGWTPCTMQEVIVTVTAGGNYPRFLQAGGTLYLNGWKDGNLNGNFCDTLCGQASEWIVQDRVVTPGTISIPVYDPGVDYLGHYDGVFRWRLSSQPLGRFGFGAYVAVACNMTCGGDPSVAVDSVGEVEDYIVHDLQLAVELAGDFTAQPSDGQIRLAWATASESENAGFEIVRDGAVVEFMDGAGTSPVRRDYQWTDAGLENGTLYHYELRSVGLDNERRILASVEAMPVADAAQVHEFALHQNYPNPFNPQTRIAFDLAEAGFTTLKVYNLMGQEVATLINGSLISGRHVVDFDASDLPSGAYLYKLTSGSYTSTQKMLLMK